MAPATKVPFLLTGVTGGLGAKVLSVMLDKHNIAPQDIIATSRSEAKRSVFQEMGVQFRVADYKDLSSLESAFSGVENLLFVSSSERDSAVRNVEHSNVIQAAVKCGVGKVWYVSLAFGGWGDGSKIGFQQAHYETESQLKESGATFVSLRAGIYSDAFPLFLNWYPSSREIIFPKLTPPVSQSKIAFTTRDELGEGIATLLSRPHPSIQPRTDKNIVLLTATETNSLVDIAEAIPTQPAIRYFEPNESIAKSAENDQGGKPMAWFEAKLVFTQGVCDGDAEVVDSALEVLLGRKPETGVEAVRRLVKEAGGEYKWHQNHVGGKGL